jgi:hypothetical protein
MTPAIAISLIGAVSAIFVSIVGAWLANRNSIVLQTRKLKEDHYIGYIEALHNNMSYDETNSNVKDYVFARDKLLLIASEEVIRKMIRYENEGIGKGIDLHDQYLTDLIKAIRFDLKIKDSNFPIVYMKSWNKKP